MNVIDFTKLKPAEYARKSSESEDKQVLSISSQHEANIKSAEYYNLPPFVHVFQEAKSAKTEHMRPEFSRMMDAIEKGSIDCIVCWKPDRLARNMTEGGKIIDLLSSGKLKAIISHDKVFYPWDNVIVLSVEFSQGKQFVKELSINVKRGQTKKASMGIPHGVAALGYLNDKTEEKGNRSWLVDEWRLNAIKKLFGMFLTGTYSAGKLHQYAISELKLTTVSRKRTGGNLITHSRIYEILKDPIYAGFFFYGGDRYELDKRLPRIITEDEHSKVKILLSRKNIPKVKEHKTVFSGFMKSDTGDFMGQDVKYQLICDCKKKFAYRDKTHCPECGEEIASLASPTYLEYIHYYNVRKKKNHLPYKSISQSKLTEILSAFLDSNLVFSNELAVWSKEYLHELKDKEIQQTIFRKERAVTLQGEYERKKSRLREMLRDEQITSTEYEEDLKALNISYSVRNTSEEDVDWFGKINEIVDLTVSMKGILQHGSVQAKRELLSKLGSNLTWNDKEISISNRKSINTLVEGIKMIKSVIPEFEPRNYIVDKGVNEKTPLEKDVFSIMLRE